MLQKTYEDAYVDESIGLTKECFAKWVFNTTRTQDYTKSKLIRKKGQKTWLALIKKKIVGSITISEDGKGCELSAFYVRPGMQGKGIGKVLFLKALDFARGRDIRLDMYAHSRKTIAIYRGWGFRRDMKRGIFYRHWDEWPEGLKAKCIYMRRDGKKVFKP